MDLEAVRSSLFFSFGVWVEYKGLGSWSDVEEPRRRSGGVVNRAQLISLALNTTAAERILSQIEDKFATKQALALADMLQASMMLRYHKRLAREPVSRVHGR